MASCWNRGATPKTANKDRPKNEPIWKGVEGGSRNEEGKNRICLKSLRQRRFATRGPWVRNTIDRSYRGGGVLTLNAEAKLDPATDRGMH